jgi:hypothetical protein
MHPLLNDINDLTIDQLSDKISEIDKRILFYSMQSGIFDSTQILSQLQQIKDAYVEKFSEKSKQQLEGLSKNNKGNAKDVVDIDDPR